MSPSRIQIRNIPSLGGRAAFAENKICTGEIICMESPLINIPWLLPHEHSLYSSVFGILSKSLIGNKDSNDWASILSNEFLKRLSLCDNLNVLTVLSHYQAHYSNESIPNLMSKISVAATKSEKLFITKLCLVYQLAELVVSDEPAFRQNNVSSKDLFFFHCVIVTNSWGGNQETESLYVKLSCFVHSCNPNSCASGVSGEDIQAIVAIKVISIGELVTVSYLSNHLQLQPRHIRRAFLMESKGFLCECQRCQEEINLAEYFKKDIIFTNSNNDVNDQLKKLCNLGTSSLQCSQASLLNIIFTLKKFANAYYGSQSMPALISSIYYYCLKAIYIREELTGNFNLVDWEAIRYMYCVIANKKWWWITYDADFNDLLVYYSQQNIQSHESTAIAWITRFYTVYPIIDTSNAFKYEKKERRSIENTTGMDFPIAATMTDVQFNSDEDDRKEHIFSMCWSCELSEDNEKLLTCTGCNLATYHRHCQKKHWRLHKQSCR